MTDYTYYINRLVETALAMGMTPRFATCEELPTLVFPFEPVFAVSQAHEDRWEWLRKITLDELICALACDNRLYAFRAYVQACESIAKLEEIDRTCPLSFIKDCARVARDRIETFIRSEAS